MDRTIHTTLTGRHLLAEPRLNKGTAFDDDERQALDLEGLLPDAVETIDDQLDRTRCEFDRLHDDLERHVFLRALQDHNEVLFYRFVQANLEDTIPIVYTPTVGMACRQFSRIFRRSRGLFLSYRTRDRMREQMAAVEGDVDVIVVTDGGRILGLGDQGVGGMGIPIGKLSLYSAFGGIDPSRTLPITLDVGTNNADRLADPQYLGCRHERITGPDYDAFVEQFVELVTERFPGVLLQWEDFAQDTASRLLHRYRDRLLSFNDDIQGTGAVALSAIRTATRVVGSPLTEQQIVIAGAGSAGTGIAAMLRAALAEDGVADPLERILMVDTRGVVHDRREAVKPHQEGLAHPAEHLDRWGGTADHLPLEQIVDGARATILVGVTGQGGLFTRPVIEALHANTPTPIVMPMSNPTSQAEATPEDILAWTGGAAIVATGSPFAPVTHNGVEHTISQANNVYAFPGLGLGAIAVKARAVSDTMLMAAAKAVAEPRELPKGAVLPPLASVPDVSRRIAEAVARCACDEGLADPLTDDQISAAIAHTCWAPEYAHIRRLPG